MHTTDLGPDPSPGVLRMFLLEASLGRRHCDILSGGIRLARCGRENATAPNPPRRNQSAEGTWFCHLTDAGRDLLRGRDLLPWVVW